MEFHQLRTLLHVAELGSVTKAAVRLQIVQPALSRQIRLLEAELGVALFERHGRGMVLTESGQKVAASATRILAELDTMRSSLQENTVSHRGTVVIGMTPTVAEIMTVPLVKRVREKHPELALRIMSGFSGHLIDWLQRGDLEIAVSYDQPLSQILHIAPIMIENLMFVTRPGSQSPSDTSPIAFRELAGTDLVLPSPLHGLRVIVEDCARRAGVTLTTTVEADSFTSMIDLVRTGICSTVLPLAPILAQVNAGILSATPIIDPTPVRKLVMAYPKDRPLPPAARYVSSVFREIAEDFVGRDIWVGRML